MKNTKLMLIAVCAVFAIAGFAAGCDEEATTCETDEDCDAEAGEVCDVAEGECQVACATDVDCEEPQTCCADGDVPSCKDECGGAGGTGGNGTGGGGGGGECPAGEGLSATDGLCHPVCGDVADCYSFAAYCASDALCYSVDEAYATCTRVQGLGGIDADAPLIFDPGQDTIGTGGNLCTKAAACTNNGNVCQFSFQYYDPTGDVPAGHDALYGLIRFVTDAGALVAPYDVVEASGNTLFIMGCFDEADASVFGGVVVSDSAGNQSNPLCLEGSAP